MRRFSGMLFVIIFCLSAGCQAVMPTTQPSQTLTLAPTQTTTPTLTPTPTLILTPAPSSTAAASASIIPAPNFSVRYHPDGGLYAGDLISLEVIPPPEALPLEGSLSVQVDPPSGPSLGSAAFAPFGIAGRVQATLIWAWDTRLLPAGQHTLAFRVEPQGYAWSETVTLLPAADLPADQAQARWASIETDYCIIHYTTGTTAERDLPLLAALADEQALRAIAQMGVEFSQPITIILLPRLLGHGGFATHEIHVSYLGRNYASNAWEMVVLHEMIHILDYRLGGDLRPSLLVEGLAVYLTGGHFKPEPLLPRAAALLDGQLGWYIPLATLADDFYAAQHEIGYLEAGALVAYMVERWGWEAYSAFYRSIAPHESGGQSAAIDAALQNHFGLSLAELEADYLAALQSQPEAAAWQEDVHLTVTYYDTLRRYQQLLDPSAYFATAWLMDSQAMRQNNILADYLRTPNNPANLALETLLISAGEDLASAPYDQAENLLAAVNQVLDGFAAGAANPFNASRLAEDYYAIASAAQQSGYLVEHVTIDGDMAYVIADAPGLNWVELRLLRQAGEWRLHPAP